MSESYLEKCIRALPGEKQAAAREAIKSIAENGDDSLLSQLLAVFEATAAYSETIPQELVRFGESFLRELDARAAEAAKHQKEADAQRETRLRELIAAQVPQLGKSLALDKVAAGLQSQSAELGRLGRSVERVRQARVGGLLFLIVLGVCMGAGTVIAGFWRSYAEAGQAKRFVENLNAAGIYAKIDRTDEVAHLTVEGPVALRGTAWRKSADGYIVGADYVVSNGGAQ
jgi:hypothetical protein